MEGSHRQTSHATRPTTFEKPKSTHSLRPFHLPPKGILCAKFRGLIKPSMHPWLASHSSIHSFISFPADALQGPRSRGHQRTRRAERIVRQQQQSSLPDPGAWAYGRAWGLLSGPWFHVVVAMGSHLDRSALLERVRARHTRPMLPSDGLGWAGLGAWHESPSHNSHTPVVHTEHRKSGSSNSRGRMFFGGDPFEHFAGGMGGGMGGRAPRSVSPTETNPTRPVRRSNARLLVHRPHPSPAPRTHASGGRWTMRSSTRSWGCRRTRTRGTSRRRTGSWRSRTTQTRAATPRSSRYA